MKSWFSKKNRIKYVILLLLLLTILLFIYLFIIYINNIQEIEKKKRIENIQNDINMRLLHIKDGLDVKHDNNEIHKEFIFGLDKNNTIIQNITFQSNIDILDDEKLKNIIGKSNEEIIEKGFLFYSFAYEVSFAHYLCQTIPKLNEYLEKYNEYKLLIPEARYNNLCKDILRLLNIHEHQIIILKDYVIYNIIDYITTIIYHPVPSNITKDHISIYKKIREPLSINPNVNPIKKIYLKRDGVSNKSFGNSETGILRKIDNEDILIDKLITHGFEIVTLGDKHITEKKNILNDINIVVTPLGANCMNFIFCNAPKNILFLSNNENFGYEYYVSLIEELNNVKINSIILKNNSISTDQSNQWNGSFNVNIEEVINTISSF